jgi:hypothetical protein
LFDYIDATILSHSSPPEAFRKLESLAKKHTEELRRITKQIQDARWAAERSGLAERLRRLKRPPFSRSGSRRVTNAPRPQCSPTRKR